MFKNISFSVLSKIVLGLLGFLRVPVLLNYLGESVFGLFVLIIAASTYAIMFELGLFPVLKNRLIQSYANDNEESFSKDVLLVVSTAISLTVLTFCFSLLFYCFDFTSVFLSSQDNLIQGLNGIFCIAFFLSGFRVATAGIINILEAKNNFFIPKIIEMIFEFFSFFILLLLVYGLNTTFSVIVFLSFLFPVLKNIYLAYYVRYEIYFSFKYFKKTEILKELKSLVLHSSHFFFIQVCSIVSSTFPSFYISKFYSLVILAEFNVLYRLISIPLLLLSAILPIFWREFGFLWAKKMFELLVQKIRRYVVATSIIFLLWGGFLFLFLDKIMLLWLNKNYGFNHLASLILLWVFVECLMYWYSTFLHSIGDFVFELKSYLISTLVISIVGYWFAMTSSVELFVLFLGYSVMLFQLIPMKNRCHKTLVKLK